MRTYGSSVANNYNDIGYIATGYLECVKLPFFLMCFYLFGIMDTYGIQGVDMHIVSQ